MKLANKKCNDSVTVPTLTMRQARGLLKHLARGWRINRNGRLQSQYVFMNFAKALAFANKIGVIAEAEKHHPDLYVAWGKCKIEIWSHKVKGLTESDFVLAAKCDRVSKPSPTRSKP